MAAAEPRNVSASAPPGVCFKCHYVALGFGGCEEQSGSPCYLSSQHAVGGGGQTECKGANEVTKPPFYKATTTENPTLGVLPEVQRGFEGR